MPKIVYVVTGNIETGLREYFFEAATQKDAETCQKYWDSKRITMYSEVMDEIPLCDEDLITQAMLGQ